MGALAGLLDGHDRVGVPVNDQGRHGDLRQVLAEPGLHRGDGVEVEAAVGVVVVEEQARDDRGVEVAGEGVVVLAGALAELLGAAEPAPVVGDDPKARLEQGRGPGLPRLATERPSVDEDDGATVAPAVVDVEGDGSVGDHRHGGPFVRGGCPPRQADPVSTGVRGQANQRLVHCAPVVNPSRW